MKLLYHICINHHQLFTVHLAAPAGTIIAGCPGWVIWITGASSFLHHFAIGQPQQAQQAAMRIMTTKMGMTMKNQMSLLLAFLTSFSKEDKDYRFLSPSSIRYLSLSCSIAATTVMAKIIILTRFIIFTFNLLIINFHLITP